MFNSLTILLAVVGLATLSAGGVAYALLYGRIQNENRIQQRLGLVQGENNGDTSVRARSNLADAAKRRKGVSDSLKELEEKQKARAKRSSAPPLSLRIEQAGLAWTRRTFLIISAVCGLVITIGAWVAGAPLWAAAAFGVAGLLGLPRWYVNFKRKRRFKKFLEEFANATDVIVRGVKAGLPLNDCIKIIANEAAEPVRSEFRMIMETQALGVPLPEAVGRLPERIPVPETSFFAIVISIQARAGGNLSEALGNLSRVLRDRKRMKGKIVAMSGEAKASAGIIGALPVIVMVLVYITSPNYIMLLFITQIGHVIIGASAIWMAMGVFVMRKMINFDY
jgi:tight adherence protein B